MKYREQYDENADAAVRRYTDIDTGDESLVDASFAKDADLNEIARRFHIIETPVPVPVVSQVEGQPVDTGDFPDLRMILDRSIAARAAFMQQPAKIRSRFHNDPAEMYEFLSDPSNVEEAIALGLAVRKPKEESVSPPATT